MSLSSHLATTGDPLREFLRERLGGTRELLRAVDAFDRTKLNNPAHLPHDPQGSYPWSLVGAAVDYRIRYALQPRFPPAMLIAAAGEENLRRFFRVSETLQAFAKLSQSVAGLGDGWLDPLDADAARYTYLLAMYESCYRGMLTADWPLAKTGPYAPLQTVLALIPEQAVKDIVELSQVSLPRLSEIAGAGRVALNPKFAGSASVGGADADLIAGNRLIEIKVARRFTDKWVDAVRQVVSYVLLDWDDRHSLRAAAIWLPRSDVLLSWTLDEFLGVLAGAPVDLVALRNDFRAICESFPRARPNRSPTVRHTPLDPNARAQRRLDRLTLDMRSYAGPPNRRVFQIRQRYLWEQSLAADKNARQARADGEVDTPGR